MHTSAAWRLGLWKVLSSGECCVKPCGFGLGDHSLTPLFVPAACVFSKSLAHTVAPRISPAAWCGFTAVQCGYWSGAAEVKQMGTRPHHNTHITNGSVRKPFSQQRICYWLPVHAYLQENCISCNPIFVSVCMPTSAYIMLFSRACASDFRALSVQQTHMSPSQGVWLKGEFSAFISSLLVFCCICSSLACEGMQTISGWMIDFCCLHFCVPLCRCFSPHLVWTHSQAQTDSDGLEPDSLCAAFWHSPN